LKRLFALVLAGLTIATVLSGCEVGQIDWRNHFYVVSSKSCLTDDALMLRNGSGLLGTGPFDAIRVDVVKTIFGDETGDGVKDVAVVLRCTRIPGPHIAKEVGYEIQIFTRNGRPLQRLPPTPHQNRGFTWYGKFVLSEIRFNTTDAPWKGHHYLSTGVIDYEYQDQECCPSIHVDYDWIWDPKSKVFVGEGDWPVIQNGP
jgi:hypothetical protein